MMIKTLKLFLLTTLIFITGCNGDVFVDDFLPGGHEEITISENDNIKEINFKSDNWNLYNVVCEIDYLIANAYTLDGEHTHLPFDEKELGTVHYTSDYIDFYVEKVSGNKLKVTLNENLHNENAELLIIVGNEYKEEYIKMVLAPTTIDGFDNRNIRVFNQLRKYTVPYSIYLSNAKTGKRRSFTGELHSEEPIDYLIHKQVLDEN